MGDRSRLPATVLKNLRHTNAPTLVFENVNGFNIPVLAGVLGASRDIYAIGLEADAIKGINRNWNHALSNPIAQGWLTPGLAKENILHGIDVDITKLRSRLGLLDTKSRAILHFALRDHQGPDN